MFSALPQVLRDWFAEEEVEVEVGEGAEARVAQTNFGDGSADGRVVLVAANDIGIDEPAFIGEGVSGKRQLWKTTFPIEVSFAGYDAQRPESDLAHRARCYGLWEKTAQAIQHAIPGAHRWTGARWEDARKHGRHGAELIATLELDVPLFDVDHESATPAPRPGAPKPATDPDP